MSKCPEFFYGNCPIIKTENKELISEFLEDLTLNHPRIGFKYTREELIEKWEKRVNI